MPLALTATASERAHAAHAMSTRNLRVKPQVLGGFARRAPLSFNDIYRAHSDMRWQRDIMEQLDSIHGKMKDLSIKTKAVEGRPCYLETYTRKGYGVTLRWRASDHKHLTADRALKLIRRLQPTMRHWFNRAGLQAEQLNHSERALRAQLRTLQANKSGAGTERLL